MERRSFESFRESLERGVEVSAVLPSQDPIFGTFVSCEGSQGVIAVGTKETPIGPRTVTRTVPMSAIFPPEEGRRIAEELEAEMVRHRKYLAEAQAELERLFAAGAEIVIDARGRMIRPGDRVYGHQILPFVPYGRLSL